MPQRKSVFSLQNLAFKSVDTLITIIGKNLLEDKEVSQRNLKELIDALQILLYRNTASCLHNRITQHCLQALEKFFKCYHQQSYKEIDRLTVNFEKIDRIIKNLALAIPQPTLKDLNLNSLCMPIQSALIENLDKMSGLESIHGLSLQISSEEEMPQLKILKSLQVLSNLTYLDMPGCCSDSILDVVSKNCKSIRSIIIPRSDQVTDCSVDNLLSCTQLEQVDMYKTSVSQRGFFKLLTETGSKNLINIGICSNLTAVLDLMEAYVEPLRTYQLQCLQYCDVDTERLFLICKYFPHLIELKMTHSTVVPDLFCLSRLQNLRKVTLSVCDFYSDRLSDFLTSRGSFITSLCLDVVRELQMSCIQLIGVSCPNIERLQFFGCEFFEDSEFPRIQFTTEPFQKLKYFSCVSDISLAQVLFVLRYALNLEELEIRPAQVVTDDFFQAIFNFNPLKQLRVLKIDYINSISVDMLKVIMTNCENICSLANFSSSTAISKEDLKSAQDWIISNNYDLTLN